MNGQTKNAKFGIIKASVEGWRFMGREARYLLKIAVMPLLAHLACNLFVLYVRPEAGTIEVFLWVLPGTAFMAWYSFLIVRRIVLGEKLETAGKDSATRQSHDHAMRASVLLALLFNMGITASAAALEMIAKSGMLESGNVVMMGLAVFTLITTLWGFRFGALPMLAAVDYPLAPFLKQVEGFEFSLRLLGLGLLSILPLIFVSEFIAAPLIDNPLEPTDNEMLFMVVLGSPMSLMVTTILTSTITHALKDILGNDSSV